MSLQRWQYNVLRVNLSEKTANSALELMDAMGREGWEMVGTICVQDNTGYVALYHFKRPVEWEIVVSVQQA